MTSGRTEFARRLRKQPTRAEDILWRRLRGSRFDGAKFRRQVPFDRYVVDFYCDAAKLVIELDGTQHGDPGQMRHDERRTAYLAGRGYRVLRFSNRDVLDNREGVVRAILAALTPTRNSRAERANFDLPARGR